MGIEPSKENIITLNWFEIYPNSMFDFFLNVCAKCKPLKSKPFHDIHCIARQDMFNQP